jgi:hypothetical protein
VLSHFPHLSYFNTSKQSEDLGVVKRRRAIFNPKIPHFFKNILSYQQISFIISALRN